MLWHMVVGWYIEEWERRDEQHVPGNDSTVMKRMSFAKKLEAKVATLFDIDIAYDTGGEGVEPRVSLAAASDERIKEILNRRRAATVCAVRDALFGVGPGVGPRDDSHRDIMGGDALIPWLRPRDGLARDPATGDRRPANSPFPLLGPDVLEELRTSSGDTPLGCAETRLVVLESYTNAVTRIAEALQENSVLLSEGQYARFIAALAEDVSSLLVALVQLEDIDTTHGVDALWRAALRYTSCAHVAQSLCLMRFGGKDPVHAKTVTSPLPALHKACQRILTLGERDILESAVETFQREHLVEHLASLTSWRQRVDIQDIIAKKKSVSRLLHAFGQLNKGTDLVSPAMVARIVTGLVDWLAEIVTDSLIDQSDISAELSEAIPRSWTIYVTGWMGCWGPLPSTSLAKLRQMCRIMRMTSGEIVSEFQDGPLGQLFERGEIVSLIGALFEPTAQVQQNLAKLGGGP